MDTKQNNYAVNEFKGGMNSDLSYDVLLPNQYVFGENIRITTNALISEINNSNAKEGSVCPIPDGIKTNKYSTAKAKRILAVGSIGDVGVIITNDLDDRWSIYRLNKTEGNITYKRIFTSVRTVLHENKFSIVLNKEINDEVVLYIADGVNQIMSINIYDDDYNSTITDESLFMSEHYFPTKKIYIDGVIVGELRTGCVLYTYRFYKKRGIKSKLAPLTNKLQVIDHQKQFEQGNADNTKTAIGFRLGIKIDDLCKSTFDKIQIYRLYYTHNNVNSDIELIYDDYIENRTTIYVNDTGITALERYTIDEFTSLDGLLFIPQSIDQNQNFMFAADIKDVTKLKLQNDSSCNTAFDARSFSMNSKKCIELYDETDIEYKGNKYVYAYSGLLANFDYIGNINKNVSLNKYADINTDTTDNYDYCRFDDLLYYGGVGKHVSWRFITTPILLHDESQIANDIPPKDIDSDTQKLYYLKYTDTDGDGIGKIELEDSHLTTKLVFEQSGVCNSGQMSYENPIVSSLFRSLKRDEVYRYGIVLYDKNGRKSDVQWIADIKTPNSIAFDTFKYTELAETSVMGDIKRFKLPMDAVEEDATERRVNLLILEQKQNNFGFLDIRDHYVGYSTSKILSQPIELHQGERVKISLHRDSLFLISGQNYIYHISDVNDPEYSLDLPIYRPDVTVHGDSFAETEFVSVTNMMELMTDGRISDGILRLSLKLVLDNEVTLNMSDKNEYTVPYDQKAHIEMYASFGYVRNEWSADDYVYAEEPMDAPSFVDVQCLITIRKPNQQDKDTIELKRLKGLLAYPLGIQFNVHDLPENVCAYQIVRCEKPLNYTKNIMLCVAARPIRLKLSKTTDTVEQFSPFYPHYILNALPYAIYSSTPSYKDINNKFGINELEGCDAVTNFGNVDERNIFLLYSPEITLSRNTSLQKIKSQCSIDFLQYCYSLISPIGESTLNPCGFILYNRLKDAEMLFDGLGKDKVSRSFMFSYYYANNIPFENKDSRIFLINGISDTLNPNWEDGFGNVQIGSAEVGEKSSVTGGAIVSAYKRYKQFISTVNNKEYLNWHCTGMYNLKAFRGDADFGQTESDAFMLVENIKDPSTNHNIIRADSATGLIGPGPSCFVASVDNKTNSPVYQLMPTYIELSDGSKTLSGTSCAYICNVTHKASQFAGYTTDEKLNDTYYGFGNFITVDSGYDVFNVFDGDVYITPFEIVLMYKAFDFNDKDTLLSGLFVYYVPIESTINNYFNYGYNYRNSSSKTLLITAGEITGVTSLDRPSNQYNMVYSDNNVSNDVYNAEYYEQDVDHVSLRIYHSLLKTFNESFDAYTYFKPLDYIDVDSRYGDITNIFSYKNMLYCWQDSSFGKISVNERSLVSDLNSNIIQLGVGAIMQRIDYIDLHYGMSKYQHVAIGAEDKIYWIDDKNKSILQYDGQKAINLSELNNVQNIINGEFLQSCPLIHYDLQNLELLCKCLGENQIVFNTKFGVATSVYTRNYLDIISLNNTIYGIDDHLNTIQYNNIENNQSVVYMPATIRFVVNKNSSTTKVFDNLEIIFAGDYRDISKTKLFFDNKKLKFCTNVDEISDTNIDYTLREGNLEYSIPRINNALYGNRCRGKWMCVEIKDQSYGTNLAISHVITKFRQSFS